MTDLTIPLDPQPAAPPRHALRGRHQAPLARSLYLNRDRRPDDHRRRSRSHGPRTRPAPPSAPMHGHRHCLTQRPPWDCRCAVTGGRSDTSCEEGYGWPAGLLAFRNLETQTTRPLSYKDAATGVITTLN